MSQSAAVGFQHQLQLYSAHSICSRTVAFLFPCFVAIFGECLLREEDASFCFVENVDWVTQTRLKFDEAAGIAIHEFDDVFGSVVRLLV